MIELKKQIVDCSQRMWLRGLVANHDGNITYKISESQFLATPTSFSKKDVTEDDLLLVDNQGKVIEGKHKVFSEMAFHYLIYKQRPDITCVVHGHPTTAGGIALAGGEIGTPSIPEAIVSLGRGIYSAEFNSPKLNSILMESDVFLVPGNGAWAVGQNILQTYLRLELVEQVAQAHATAKIYGGAKPLPRDQVEELLKKRQTPKAST